MLVLAVWEFTDGLDFLIVHLLSCLSDYVPTEFHLRLAEVELFSGEGNTVLSSSGQDFPDSGDVAFIVTVVGKTVIHDLAKVLDTIKH